MPMELSVQYQIRYIVVDFDVECFHACYCNYYECRRLTELLTRKWSLHQELRVPAATKMQVCTCPCMCVHVHVHACVYMHACVYVHVCTCMCVHACVYVHVYMCMCVHVRMC